MARKGELSPQQKEFADEYIVNGGNIYQAAIKAGYSHNYANTRACEMLGNERIKAYIDDRMRPILQARTLRIEEALAMVCDIAKGEENAEGKRPSDNTRLKALDMYLRANGQYTDKVEVSGAVDVADILKQAKARAEKGKKSTD